MNIAEKFHKELSAVEIKEDGFKEEQWESIVKKAKEAAKRLDWPYGVDSYDSSIELSFEDGSKILIHNPKQSAFCGFSFVEKPL